MERNIYITENDRKRLLDLLRESQNLGYRGSEYLRKLRSELDRATIVDPHQVPPSVITMNSTALLIDLDTGEEMEYTLVFPEDAAPTEGKISVLAPIGTAMLGYSVGDTFDWEIPNGKSTLKVEKIIYQPEASGDYQ